MAVHITELTFLSQLAHRYGLPVPKHLEATASRSQIREAMTRWGKGVVKADVMSGGRGKAGAVAVVEAVAEAIQQLKRLSVVQVQGRPARTAYITEFVPAKLQVYSAITYDSRCLGPSLTLSLKGGVDIESVGDSEKRTLPVDVFKGLDAYQASDLLTSLDCPRRLVSPLSRTLVTFWDMFISTGMRMCEVNPWRIDENGRICACDFKAILDEANYKVKNPNLKLPEYPETITEFAEEMAAWDASSHRGQAHVSDLGGRLVLPMLFGGGASTIVAETLDAAGGSPIFLSDFGGNPPYERMLGTARRCFRHHLGGASLLLILGGKANNTRIDATFRAIGDALIDYFQTHGPVSIPVVIGRGGPGMVQGFFSIRDTLESLRLPYVIFGHDTPLTLVAEYAARLARNVAEQKEAPQ